MPRDAAGKIPYTRTFTISRFGGRIAAQEQGNPDHFTVDHMVWQALTLLGR